MEEQLQKLLGDPEAMQKIMAMAQSLGASAGQKQDAPSLPSVPDIDPGMLKKLAGLAGQGTIDPHQKALLNALVPYLTRQRIGKLENAMRAAKMASFAAAALNTGKGR